MKASIIAYMVMVLIIIPTLSSAQEEGDKKAVVEELLSTLNKNTINGKDVELTDCDDETVTVSRNLVYNFTYDYQANALVYTVKGEIVVETYNKATKETSVKSHQNDYEVTIEISKLQEMMQTEGFINFGCTWDGPLDATWVANCSCIIKKNANGSTENVKMLSIFLKRQSEAGLHDKLNLLITSLKG